MSLEWEVEQDWAAARINQVLKAEWSGKQIALQCVQESLGDCKFRPLGGPCNLYYQSVNPATAPPLP